ncbi:MAG: hypothetical protein K0Q57_285 [Gammaproteobacteria bacterium]|jgi:hypothetical protein|nr:hypothetical protein [Gammaproteobacteria bacterium]
MPRNSKPEYPQALIDSFLQVSQDYSFINEFITLLENPDYAKIANMLYVGYTVLTEPEKFGFRFDSSLNKRVSQRGYALNKSLADCSDLYREYAITRLSACLLSLASEPNAYMNKGIHKQLLRIFKSSEAIGLDESTVKLLKKMFARRIEINQAEAKAKAELSRRQSSGLFTSVKKALSSAISSILKGISMLFGCSAKRPESSKPVAQAENPKRLPEPVRINGGRNSLNKRVAKSRRQVASGNATDCGSYSTATSLRAVSEQARKASAAVMLER